MNSSTEAMMHSIPAQILAPGETISGRGELSNLARHTAHMGPRGLIVHGRGSAAETLRTAAEGAHWSFWEKPAGEPSLAGLDALRAECRDLKPDWIAGLGGGAAIDLAKAAAALQRSDEPASVFQQGKPVPEAGLPIVAIPTTAGAGSEATVVSVLTDTEAGLKKSIRGRALMPALVMLDPALVENAPRDVRLHSGLDAFTQALESLISRHATGYTRALAAEALGRINASISDFVTDTSGGAGEDMQAGAYLAGLALSHSRLGLVHGLAHPLGVRFELPHGQVCALALPAVLSFNRAAPGDAWDELSSVLGEDPEARVAQLFAKLGVTNPLSGQRAPDDEQYVEEVLASGSTAANPRPVDRSAVDAVTATVFARRG